MSNYMNARRFIDQMLNDIRTTKSNNLSKLFSIRNKAYQSIYFSEENKSYLNEALENSIESVAIWSDIIEYHILARNCVIDKDFLNAFEYESKSFKSLVDLLKDSKDENWQLPILFSTSVDLRLLAYACDSLRGNKEKNNLDLENRYDEGEQKLEKYAEKAAESLMYCFRNICTDTRSDTQVTKRWGMMHLVNQLFKIYFKINKVNLCNPLKRAIENSGFKEYFPQSHQTTYKFYVGRQAMFENDYDTAASYFEYAFLNCPKSYIKNKKMILVYLVPVNMLRGRMPKEGLLLKYDLKPFAEIVKAVKQGNILKFNQDMIKYEDFFIQNGVYLFLEKLKMTTYRNLFKKIVNIVQIAQIPIDIFVSILEYLQDEDIDNDVCQCILSNLIYDNKIKGYISHKHNKLVISKDFKQAFPSLSPKSS